MIHYGPRSGKVQWLAVHRDHQGQGLGKLRMSAAIEVAPSAPPPPTARLRRTRAGTERDGLGVGLRRTPILRKSRQLALALPDERPIIQPLSFSLKPAARDRHGGPLSRASCCQLGIRLSCLCLSAQAGVLHGCAHRISDSRSARLLCGVHVATWWRQCAMPGSV